MAGDPLKLCSESDLRRFALCFINCDSPTQVDWETASKQFNPETQIASFKTVTSKALNRVIAGLTGSPEANGVSSAGGKKMIQGSKRKAGSQAAGSTVKRKTTTMSKNTSKAKGDVGERLSDDEALDATANDQSVKTEVHDE
ncbi:uncharacterized protein K489DRAFT_412707 [Dissoconium aciculare CBS 342.82]|uniref:Uncharacterized protein n=1 Tax=Dissoconium aciculare CBS 342.82 TaxID=1314786 RepID=A0A6J3LUN4_9PEZI|nr:uncharacterized protein K489DRAFT_412707 [Dissoconium aciculare CBS 342.82]KAF1819368.1 hypothetical protein K489DRAFT_412707 [Dissoconium aciculare CBS 342.82]